jgi:VWFA-related protein
MFLIFVILLLSAISLPAQTSSSDAQNAATVLKTTSQAVVVDVVVTKSNDEQIDGLHQQDFLLMEDGKPQKVDFFEEHTAVDARPAAIPALPPHVFSNQIASPQSESVNVLFLDSLNTAETDQARVHRQMTDFVEHMSPGTQVAIFALNERLRLLQGFTADPSLLKAALSSKTSAVGTTTASRTRDDDLRDKEDIAMQGSSQAAEAEARSLGEFSNNQAGRRASTTLNGLDQLARALAAIPGRKNLIWFAGSFPVALFPDGNNRQTLIRGREIPEALRQTVNLLTQSKVAIYPISAQGILSDTTSNADTGGSSTGDFGEQSAHQNAATRNSTTATMEQLAIDTGGEAIYSTNDLSNATAHAIQNGARYYTLAYTPANEQTDGKFRCIEVKVSQGKFKLEYRRGYYADDAATLAATRPASDPLAPLLANGMTNATQIVYLIHVAPSSPQPSATAARAGGNTKFKGHLTRYKLDFLISASGLNLEAAPNGMHTGKIEIALVAHGRDGATVNWTGGAMTLSLNAASYAKAQSSGIAAPMEIDLPDTDISLATGVYDLNSQRAGTLELPQSAITAPASTY